MNQHSHHHDRDQINPRITRRRFLRLGVAAAGSAAAGTLWWALHEKTAPLISTGTGRGVVIPDYSLPQTASARRLAVVTGSDHAAVVRAAIAELGGIGSFIEPGDIVLIKPNVAFDRPPAFGATTNPAVVAELVRLVRRAGAGEVIVADNPINAPSVCFERTGIGPAAERAGAEVLWPRSSRDFRSATLPAGTLLRNWPVFYRPLARIDKLIGVACLKDHNLSSASMCMKNWYGLLGSQRQKFHQDIDRVIAELSMMFRPTLVVLDGTRILFRNGPTGGSLGDVKIANTVIAGTDQLAVDAFGYTLLQRDPARLNYLRLAGEAGAGEWRYQRFDVRRINL